MLSSLKSSVKKHLRERERQREREWERERERERVRNRERGEREKKEEREGEREREMVQFLPNVICIQYMYEIISFERERGERDTYYFHMYSLFDIMQIHLGIIFFDLCGPKAKCKANERI